MRRTIGGNAQDRRRRRRAAERRQMSGVAELSHDDVRQIQELAAPALPAIDADAATEVAEMARQALGGKPSKGTKPDRRLKENAQKPEEAALDALAAYEPEQQQTDVSALVAAIVRARPDLADFEEQVARLVLHALDDVLTAAAGDVAWGPEDGFIDLLCDVNLQLSGGVSDGYDGDGEWANPYSGPRAVDAGVKLDKVLICDGDDYYVAGVSIDSAGEPILAGRDEWLSVEQGWIESNESMTAATQLRFALRDVVLTADGATAPPLPAEHEPGEVLPGPSQEPTPPPAGEARADGQVGWTATFVPEGVLTEDGRAFAPGALILPPAESARDLPLTLMAMIETSAEGGHDGAKVAGRIDQLWREGNLVKASGVFSEEEFGQMIARMVESEELTGLSVDIAPLEWEHVPRSQWFDEAGNWIAQRNDDGEWGPADGEEPALEDAIDLFLGGGEDLILVITKGVIGMATVCPFPAFGKASIGLTASGVPRGYETMTADFQVDCESLVAAGLDCGCAEVELETAETAEDESLTAAAAGLAPVAPPVGWFEDPQLEELTPLTITEDGRVYGHAWAWETCHLSFDGCVTAPHSETNYAYYMLGEVECEDGDRISVGKITLDTSHAGQRLSRQEATRHYDHTGTVAAHVTFGEDEHGGWFAGAINPELTEEKLRVLRGATVSGDWRGVDGNLELVALLAVNVPGFPVPRAPRALVAAGVEEPEMLALTAAGIVREARLSAEQADEIRELAAGTEA